MCRISLDDFGTGYSSLSYLHNFPLQKVKIDRSFLEGIDGDRPQTLLRGIARLSADLGMSVVVEGIETNEQLELISKDGTVTEAQGYLVRQAGPGRANPSLAPRLPLPATLRRSSRWPAPPRVRSPKPIIKNRLRATP